MTLIINNDDVAKLLTIEATMDEATTVRFECGTLVTIVGVVGGIAMGMDFVALIRYPGITAETLKIIDETERAPPQEILHFEEFLKHLKGWTFSAPGKALSSWERLIPGKGFAQPATKPNLPDTKAVLAIADLALLTFGQDTLGLGLVLRWSFFLKDMEIRQAVLALCRSMVTRFRATDCILTSDFSPIWIAFGKGMSFEAAIRCAGPEHPEVSTIDELYIAVDDQGTWDSRGYWRMPL
jgi:hypothetical protein